ncbi:hypothetical protein [Geomobilimonas luticola]|uniref:Uncharacterized protein n=1 Tax=Geomobilimonas luticola TaxID=1114878 RepID=A0ABS5SCL0_9BACT|nr:hypothetical protein [Geomobilimonas luticola]MBT0652910.1 hypothetical protein [Geomobilimonas luticola]
MVKAKPKADKAPRGALNQQVARAGEFYVAAELNKRGAYLSFTNEGLL